MSAYFAKNPGIFFRPAGILNQKLATLITNGVDLNSILNAPATFRINLCTLEKRLAELKSASVEPIFSWMLTCGPAQTDELVFISDMNAVN